MKMIDNMINKFMKEEDVYGMVLLIIQSSYISRVVSYGIGEKDKKSLISIDNIWPLGEITQAYTAVAIMQLYEEDQLNIYLPISNYLKNLPEEWRGISVIELLQHSSGIPDYRLSLEFKERKIYSVQELIDLVKGSTLSFKHGKKVEKSATNFLLLSEIIEKVSNISYYEFVKKYQFDVLGLKKSMFYKDIKSEYKISEGYREEKNDLEKISFDCFKGATGKGFSDIFATIENVGLWEIGLEKSILIKDSEIRNLIYKPAHLSDEETYPAMAGWIFYNYPQLMEIKGSTIGFSTFLSRYIDKEEGLSIILICNKEKVELTQLARGIAGVFNKKLGTINNTENFFSYESSFGFEETIYRIEKGLHKLNIPIFAKFNHAENAKEVFLDLRKTTLLVFGSPQVGTLLMQKNQTLALELPLRILILEDEKGSVWIEFRKASSLTKDYSFKDDFIIEKIEQLMEDIAIKAGNAY